MMADSPLAVPSMTSPSLGMISPALTGDHVALLELADETTKSTALSRRALVVPSGSSSGSRPGRCRNLGTASAKLAKDGDKG